VGAGAREVLVAVGGSATADGGRGAIDAIREGGGLVDARLAVLCDVELDFEDAARVFGPQKGADREMVARLERPLAALASWLPREPRGVPATGALGGLSGGLWAAFDAELRRAPRRCSTRCARRAPARVTARGRRRGLHRRAELRRQDCRRARAPRAVAGVPIHAVVGTSRLLEHDRARVGLERVWTASTLEEIEEAGCELGAAAAGG
jgi:glycerate kinase